MYMGIKLKKASFSLIKVIRSEILFSKGNQYAVLCLKQSKTNIEHTRVQIILITTGKKYYLVAALTRLYNLDPQPTNTPLFRLSFRAFSCFSMISALKKQIALIDLTQADYFGYSFHKSTA